MAVRSQIGPKHRETYTATQMELVTKLVKKYSQPLTKLFEQAELLEEDYKKAQKRYQAGVEDNNETAQNLALDKYKHDRTLYIKVLNDISKYLYATLKQIEITTGEEKMPTFEIKLIK